MNTKKLKLAAIIFMPIGLILFLVSGMFSYLNQQSIYSLDEAMNDQFEKINEEKWNQIDQVITKEDWQNLSNQEIDAKLVKNNLPPIDSINQLSYEEAVTKNYNPNTIKNKYLSSKNPFEAEELKLIETSLSQNNTKNLLLVLSIGGLLAGLIAWWLAIRSLKPLEEALEKQKEFVSNVSHELRTPLTMLKTEAEVLLRGNEPINEYKTFVKNTIQDIDTITDMSTKLLELAKIKPKNHTKQKNINITPIWNRLAKKFAERAKQEEKKFIMKPLNKKIEINSFPINAENFLQIFLDNAFKYSPKNSQINATIKPSNQKTVINISNTNSFITTAQQERIFDRFYRAETERSTQGYGLGLALAKEAVEAIKGTISVHSNKKETKFVIEIPH